MRAYFIIAAGVIIIVYLISNTFKFFKGKIDRNLMFFCSGMSLILSVAFPYLFIFILKTRNSLTFISTFLIFLCAISVIIFLFSVLIFNIYYNKITNNLLFVAKIDKFFDFSADFTGKIGSLINYTNIKKNIGSIKKKKDSKRTVKKAKFEATDSDPEVKNNVEEIIDEKAPNNSLEPSTAFNSSIGELDSDKSELNEIPDIFGEVTESGLDELLSDKVNSGYFGDAKKLENESNEKLENDQNIFIKTNHEDTTVESTKDETDEIKTEETKNEFFQVVGLKDSRVEFEEETKQKDMIEFEDEIDSNKSQNDSKINGEIEENLIQEETYIIETETKYDVGNFEDEIKLVGDNFDLLEGDENYKEKKEPQEEIVKTHKSNKQDISQEYLTNEYKLSKEIQDDQGIEETYKSNDIDNIVGPTQTKEFVDLNNEGVLNKNNLEVNDSHIKAIEEEALNDSIEQETEVNDSHIKAIEEEALDDSIEQEIEVNDSNTKAIEEEALDDSIEQEIEVNDSPTKAIEEKAPDDSIEQEDDHHKKKEIDNLINKAFERKEKGDFQEAARLFNEALDKGPEDDELVFYVILDICKIYKDFGAIDLAKDILNGYLEEYCEIMTDEIKNEIIKNLE